MYERKRNVVHLVFLIYLVQATKGIQFYKPHRTDTGPPHGRPSAGYVIDGCPMDGCCPRQTHRSAVTLFPTSGENVKVAWRYSGNVANPAYANGCVVNSANIICPDGESFVGLDPLTGKVKWNDYVLVNSSMPILDTYGNVVATDGRYLLQYKADGTMLPVINFYPPYLMPAYSMSASDNGFLIVASQTEEIVAYGADGICFASILLNGTMGSESGRYINVAVPASNQNSRIYYLTVFVPASLHTSKLGFTKTMFRLYAIDLRDVMVGRFKVIWHVDLAPALLDLSLYTLHSRPLNAGSVLVYGDTIVVGLRLPDSVQEMLWVVQDQSEKGAMIKCKLPTFPIANFAMDTNDLESTHESPPDESRVGRAVNLVYLNRRRDYSSVQTMNQNIHTEYKRRGQGRRVNNDDNNVYMLTVNSLVFRLNLRTCQKQFIFDPRLYSISAQITSKISIISAANRKNGTILVFGATAVEGFRSTSRKHNMSDLPPFEVRNGVIAIEVPRINSGQGQAKLLWAHEIPDNLTVMGQIGGLSISENGSVDANHVNMMVVYAQNTTHSAVYSIQNIN